MGLQLRLWLVVAVLFGIIYAVIVAIGNVMGVGGWIPYAILAFVMVLIQYLVGPYMVALAMRVRNVSEQEEPELHRMVAELAEAAHIPKPKVGISSLPIPNAFAYGRTLRDGRVCVTQGILKLLNKDELRAVLGHEISHLKHRDMAIITILSVIPMILWFIAWTFMFRTYGGRRGNQLVLIGIAAFLFYFITNLLILYASRIREYYADRGSVRLGNQPHYLASALYKLVYGTARVPKEAMREAEGMKAFFASDPSRAYYEIRELKQVDQDMSGTIDESELMALRNRTVKVGFGGRMLEILSTHPNMLQRIRHLSSLSYM